ncbi:zonadhesin-like [Achroia grisella]|uniref:zonadhesin-like n=1 Tax=Achroia grisella TaxID=688607 RepID=UPI0027D2694C|nr:zonadhesin-like [Achroia grisella]
MAFKVIIFSLLLLFCYMKAETNCGDNEVLDNCPTSCASEYCPTKETKPQECPFPDPCPEPVCRCQFNYRRAVNGTCIPSAHCPPFPCTGRNEHYVACPPLCPSDDCSQATPTGDCPSPFPILIVVACAPQCRCIDHYWRKNGTCVPYAQCFKETAITCGSNENEVECLQNCTFDSCPKSQDETNLCTNNTGSDCQPGCKCDVNYRRAENGTCIPTTDCPPFACPGQNEYYHPCPPDCTDDYDSISCNGTCKNTTLNTPNECVPKSAITCGSNENEVECLQNCTFDSCPTSQDETNVCTNNTGSDCQPGCKCAFNYRLDDNGNCIPTTDCPPFDCPGVNERYDPCPPYCSDNCGNIKSDGTCNIIGHIGVRLECFPDSLKRELYSVVIHLLFIRLLAMKRLVFLCLWSFCVITVNCTEISCTGEHEYYECGPACQNICSELHIQNKTHCPIVNIKCNDMCYCDDGYARDNNGKCIPIEDCPESRRRRSTDNGIECGPNEVQVDCLKNCTYDSCPTSADNKTVATCTDSDNCVPGCKCAFNYRRAANGTCIPTKACPPFDCPGVNEHYDPCPPYCSDNCWRIKPDGSCNIIGRIGVRLQCFPKCRCLSGYGRLNGVCVPNDECKKCCAGPNEYYNEEKQSCPPDTCEALVARYDCRNSPPPAPGCSCESGYLRLNLTSPCIPICDCPQMQYSPDCQSYFLEPTRCVRANEELSCVKGCPPEKTCRNRGILFSCFDDGKDCTPKCVCKKGFYRSPNGDCLTESQCDLCPGEHEYYACGGACDNVCSQLHVQNKTNCPIVNIRCNDKCYCDDGYARDSENKCIPIEKCQPICGPNEVFSDCARSCPPETCFSIVAFFRCDANQPCEKRCICKPGFLRLKDGTPCIPTRQCPQLANSPDFN